MKGQSEHADNVESNYFVGKVGKIYCAHIMASITPSKSFASFRHMYVVEPNMQLGLEHEMI